MLQGRPACSPLRRQSGYLFLAEQIDPPPAGIVRITAALPLWLVNLGLLLLRQLERGAGGAGGEGGDVPAVFAGPLGFVVTAGRVDTGFPVAPLIDESGVPLVPFRVGSGVCDPALIVVAVPGGRFPAGVPARRDADLDSVADVPAKLRGLSDQAGKVGRSGAADDSVMILVASGSHSPRSKTSS